MEERHYLVPGWVNMTYEEQQVIRNFLLATVTTDGGDPPVLLQGSWYSVLCFRRVDPNTYYAYCYSLPTRLDLVDADERFERLP